MWVPSNAANMKYCTHSPLPPERPPHIYCASLLHVPPPPPPVPIRYLPFHTTEVLGDAVSVSADALDEVQEVIPRLQELLLAQEGGGPAARGWDLMLRGKLKSILVSGRKAVGSTWLVRSETQPPDLGSTWLKSILVSGRKSLWIPG